MKRSWEFGSYNAYLDRLSTFSGIPLVKSIEETDVSWGLRQLSASDFAHLAAHSLDDDDLNDRWLNRMQIGYDREKSQMAMEIEDIFADVPCIDFDRHDEENAA